MIQWLKCILKRQSFEGHYDYCEVFVEHDDLFYDNLHYSGRSCSEDCANYPGTKVLLELPSGRVTIL